MAPPTGNRIHAVLFDLGGTLVDFADFPAVEDMAARAGLPVDADALSHWFGKKQEENDQGGETWSLEEFWRKVLEGATGGPVSPTRWTEFYRAVSTYEFRPSLFSDVPLCLDQLKASHLKLGVVTNHISEMSARQVLAHAGVLGFFDAVVASGTERIAKPDPRIFQRGAERLKIPPHETLYVGDKPNTDVRAAERAGLHGLWLHREGTGYGEDPPEITSLGEVPIWITQFEVSGRGFGPPTADFDEGPGGVPQRPRRRL
ncbi:MAG: HAD family hydrolase [Thermoplasmata archaeon]|nr:HAD family hydrolase [Thermoplasmata archaeon]